MSDHDQSPDNDPTPGPPRGALVALVLVIVLVAAVMFIMHRLNQAGQLQDCVASGRTNCAPIDTQHH